MANPQTGAEFVALLEKSQLLRSDVLDKIRPQISKHHASDPKRLAKTLIKNHLISEYQARQLLAGRYKGFYVGKYKILAVIGAGGMGRVFLSEQVSMERLVAIKVIGQIKRKNRKQEILARFKREAKAVAALRHENIIHAYDFDEENGVPYIVMEFVEGIDTATIFQKFGRLPYQHAVEYARQAALGLQHAHEANLVHRDIKPGNLLVDTSGVVKILDLGLCSAFGDQNDDSITVDQDQLGTVDYIAPEQAVDSHSVDHRADIYSLGATLYSLIAGQVLFPGKSTTQKLLLHQTTDPQPIQELVSAVPAELAAIIARMLAKNPEERYQSAKAVAEDLQKYAAIPSPPYDTNVLKFTRNEYEPQVGQAPEPNDITVNTLQSGSSMLGAESGAKKSSVATSQITMRDALDEFDPISELGDEYTELALPVVRSKKKRGKSKKKSNETNLLSLIVGGVSLVAILIVAVTMFRSSLYSATEPEGAEIGKGAPIPAVDHSEWVEHVSEVANSTDILCYFPFRPGDHNSGTVKNAAETTFGDLTIHGALWKDGRWPQKGAVRLHGHRSGEYVAFTDEDSRKIDFLTSTSIAVWFKVNEFNAGWQAIIGQGDHTWRLQRLGVTNQLAFCMNKPAKAGAIDSKNPLHSDTLIRLEGRTNVNDGRWHQAVIVFDIEKAKPEMRLYVDGRLDNRCPGSIPHVDNKPVWLGANSETNFLKQESNVIEGRGIRTFDGWIDEVAIWGRALTDDDVLQSFAMGNVKQSPVSQPKQKKKKSPTRKPLPAMAIFQALDQDGNQILNQNEINKSVEAIRSLDKNSDKKVHYQEMVGDNPGGALMRIKMIRALNDDDTAALIEAEYKKAPRVLRSLDANKDGILDFNEIGAYVPNKPNNGS